MEIEKLIADLKEMAEWAESNEWETPITLFDTLTKAGETIKLLWLIAKTTRIKKYKILIEDMEGK